MNITRVRKKRRYQEKQTLSGIVTSLRKTHKGIYPATVLRDAFHQMRVIHYHSFLYFSTPERATLAEYINDQSDVFTLSDPAKDILECMRVCVEDWDKYVAFAKLQNDTPLDPPVPSLYFFSKFFLSAVTFTRRGVAPSDYQEQAAQ